MTTRFFAVLASVAIGLSGCSSSSGGSEATPSTAAEATSAARSQIWVIYDSNSIDADLDGEMDCLVNHTNFNSLIDTFNSSVWGGLLVQWAPQGGASGHSGSMRSAYPGQCGRLYAPNAQCLTNLVLDNQSLGVPRNHDVFLYVVHDGGTQCGGGNDAAINNGMGEAVRGAGGATINVYTATIADGWGYNPCQQRVAMHELYEAVTQVDAADCCTGQTPGNLGPDAAYSCSTYWGYGPNNGPAGWGSYALSCNGRTWAGQRVEPWSPGRSWSSNDCGAGHGSCWQPGTCTTAH